MCGDSKIHTLRPSYARAPEETPDPEAILPKTYTSPEMRVSNFYLRAAISPDGKYLASGSGKGGVMTWEIDGKADSRGEVQATRLRYNQGREADISALDWGHDMVCLHLSNVSLNAHADMDQFAACAGDSTTRIWRSRHEADSLLKSEDWYGRYP
jgi:denticleless